jgi:tetratricopeptide (TPR) repeat protein
LAVLLLVQRPLYAACTASEGALNPVGEALGSSGALLQNDQTQAAQSPALTGEELGAGSAAGASVAPVPVEELDAGGEPSGAAQAEESEAGSQQDGSSPAEPGALQTGVEAPPGAPETSARRLRAAEHDARCAELEARFQAGVSAYRAGDYGEARDLWRALLREAPAPLPPGHGQPLVFSSAALLFNLGNACLRTGVPLEALAAYEAARRLNPRDSAIRANLERARLAAGLDLPAPPGPWQRMTEWLRWLQPGERRWLALLGAVPLALALLYEALAGGAAARRWLVLTLLGAVLACLPLCFERFGPEPADAMVVAAAGAQLNSEPREDAKAVGRVAAGEMCLEIDRLPGWRRIQRGDGQRGWLPTAAIFRISAPLGPPKDA